MSDYRDDSNDTAVISDESWLGLKGFIVEDFAKVAAVALITIGTLTTDSATASDESWDKHTRYSQVEESATVSDAHGHTLYAKQLVVETHRVSESLTHSVGVLHEDTAQVSDGEEGKLVLLEQVVEAAVITDDTWADWTGQGWTEELAVVSAEVLASNTVRTDLTDSLTVSDETWAVWEGRDILTEQAVFGDATFGKLSAAVQVSDTVKAGDKLIFKARDTTTEALQASDGAFGKLRAWDLLTDSAQVTDEPDDGIRSVALLTDSVTARDTTWGLLHAVQLVTDSAQAEDWVEPATGGSQVWTANSVASWGTSRYLLDATGIASINELIYLTTPDGVFALDGDTEEIEGWLMTGSLDVGGGTLSTPVGMYLEYELDGALEVEVTQYQNGISPDSYTYDLPAEAADTLTNGRVMFGKGLRGRHFSFAVTITGQRAYINDMSLLVAPIKRRV